MQSASRYISRHSGNVHMNSYTGAIADCFASPATTGFRPKMLLQLIATSRIDTRIRAPGNRTGRGPKAAMVLTKNTHCINYYKLKPEVHSCSKK